MWAAISSTTATGTLTCTKPKTKKGEHSYHFDGSDFALLVTGTEVTTTHRRAWAVRMGDLVLPANAPVVREREPARITQVVRPAAFRQRAVVRAGLDQAHRSNGILGQPRRHHAACGAAANDNHVVSHAPRIPRLWERIGCPDADRAAGDSLSAWPPPAPAPPSRSCARAWP